MLHKCLFYVNTMQFHSVRHNVELGRLFNQIENKPDYSNNTVSMHLRYWGGGQRDNKARPVDN